MNSATLKKTHLFTSQRVSVRGSRAEIEIGVEILDFCFNDFNCYLNMNNASLLISRPFARGFDLILKRGDLLSSDTLYEDDLTVWEFWKVCVTISTTVRGSEAKGLCNVYKGIMIIVTIKNNVMYPSLSKDLCGKTLRSFFLTPDT